METKTKKYLLLVGIVEEEEDALKELLSSKYDFFLINREDPIEFLKNSEREFDMVLFDLAYSRMDLDEFIEKLRGEEKIKSIPLMILSDDLKECQEALKMGADEFTLKPIEDKEGFLVRIANTILKEGKEEGMEEVPALKIVNLHKSYGKKKVLKGLNLEVYNGELFGFIGRNGIGKSTTIDCCIGVKRFDSGTIEIEGYSIKEEPLIVKSRYGYVASEPTCYETMTGYEYLEFIASIYKLSEAEFNGNVRYLAKRLVLTDEDLAKPIASYSHGMKQKVCLIASLLNNPDIWILDEPTVGLDIMAVEELKTMMREYANHGKCVFITSHNIDIIAKICDRVAIINDGVVVDLLDFKKDPNKRLQLPRIFLRIFGVNA